MVAPRSLRTFEQSLAAQEHRDIGATNGVQPRPAELATLEVNEARVLDQSLLL
ncbi:MAG TPA: hypothetical protein VNO30_23815 [Kofleriaceae bacterium]|nr:hypothetical protein [Kofleriaceae bacterium]